MNTNNRVEFFHSIILNSVTVFRNQSQHWMHLTILLDNDICQVVNNVLHSHQDRISGSVVIRKTGCVSSKTVIQGVVILQVIIVFICSGGLFSRRRITLCEEKKSMEFRLEGTNSFEFSRSDLEKRLNVVLKYLSDV